MKILIIDIETTGFLPKGGHIVEVGIVELDLETGGKNILFNRLVAEPEMTFEELERSWIVENSSLTVEEFAENAEPIEKVRDVIQNILNEYPAGATAYNRIFDFDFLEDRAFTFPKKLPCPMILSTPVCRIPFPNGKGTKWPKVQEAYDFFFPGNKYVELHRGADDAVHEADIVLELYKRGVFKIG